MRDPPRSRRAAKPHGTPRRWIRGCRGGRCRCGGDQESEATASRPRTGPSRQASRRRNWARAAGRTYVVSRGPRRVGGPSSSVRPSRNGRHAEVAARAPIRFPLKRTPNTRVWIRAGRPTFREPRRDTRLTGALRDLEVRNCQLGARRSTTLRRASNPKSRLRVNDGTWPSRSGRTDLGEVRRRSCFRLPRRSSVTERLDAPGLAPDRGTPSQRCARRGARALLGARGRGGCSGQACPW
jgi:hypothetical protein